MTCGTFYHMMNQHLGHFAPERNVMLCFEPWDLMYSYSCIFAGHCNSRGGSISQKIESANPAQLN